MIKHTNSIFLYGQSCSFCIMTDPQRKGSFITTVPASEELTTHLSQVAAFLKNEAFSTKKGGKNHFQEYEQC